MKRHYVDGEMNDVTIFTGIEIEKTPAHGLNTLFVVGIQPVNILISAMQDLDIKHIYFGANHSFHGGSSIEEWKEWDDMLRPFLDQNHLWITLDMDIKYAESVLDEGWVEYSNFIPVISCKIPYIQQFGYNAQIKIDDKAFQKSNPGVWVHNLHDLMNRKKFTSWAEYYKDIPIS